MKRRAINLATACSAIFLVATLAIGVRSYFVADRLTHTILNPKDQWAIRHHAFRLQGMTPAKTVQALSLGSGDGQLIFTRIEFMIPVGQRVLAPGEGEPDYSQDVPYATAVRAGFAIEHPPDARWVGTPPGRGQWLGFSNTHSSWVQYLSYWNAPSWYVYAVERQVPFWFVATIFAVVPATRGIIFLRRQRRFAAGHCPTCGYDLRATPQRCPECGWVVTHRSAPGAVPAGR